MQDVPLIPLRVLFGNPVYSSAKLSPDGSYISYLKPSKDKDVLNVWIRPQQAAKGTDAGGERMVTNDKHRGIRIFTWSEDSRYILFLQDKDGDEDWHLYAKALDDSPARELTPFKGVRVSELLTDHRFPEEVLVGMNQRDPQLFDMHRLNLDTGEITMDTVNPGDILSWCADDCFKIRAALAMNPADGSKTLRVRDGTDESSPWHDVILWPQDEEGSVIGFSKDGRSIYVASSLGRDTTELQLISTTSTPSNIQVVARLASSPQCDVGEVLLNKLSREPEAVALPYLRQSWQVLDPNLQQDFELLQAFKASESADLTIESRSTDNTTWLVSFLRDNGPVEYYLYDRSLFRADKDRLTFLFVNRPDLNKYKLARRHPTLIPARDGLQLPAYLSLPPVRSAPDFLLPPEPSSQTDVQQPGWQALSNLQLPLVLCVHGGPWARDLWGFDATAQLFTNRGYAVLQVNYRGSSGFGKSFLHLGDKQWGVGTMQHDLTDAVQWAVQAGIADPIKVAIYGGSYGGYACLAGLTFTPELYCCGVDIVGPSHIKTLLQSIPPYWAPLKRQLIDRIGDPENDEQVNQRISPLFHVQNISAPLLIAQGANDPRVKKTESDQIYLAMVEKGLEVQYFLYEDEGHGFARPPNRLHFASMADQFLAKHLGGKAETPLRPKGAKVVAMHKLESLNDWQPAADSAGTAAAHQPGIPLAAVTAVGAAIAAAAARTARKKTDKKDVQKTVGLLVGVPAALLLGGAALIVGVLRGLSPRR